MSNNIGHFHSGIKSNVNFGVKPVDLNIGRLNKQRKLIGEKLANQKQPSISQDITSENISKYFGINTDPILHQPGRIPSKVQDTFESSKPHK